MIRKYSSAAVFIGILSALLAGSLTGCNTNDGGTEIPNELVGREFIAGKGPAADTRIDLIPVGYLPGAPGADSGKGVRLTATTDPQGRFSFKDVAPGQYNVIATKDGLGSIRDSISFSGRGLELAADTLKSPGSLTGYVKLEELDDPQSVIVQVLGTTVFVNVEPGGVFTLKDLAPGEYRIRISSILPLYVPLFKEIRIRSGVQDTLLPALQPFYSGIPSVRGLTVRAGAGGVLKLSWPRSAYFALDAYLIYRDTVGTLLASTIPFAATTDTFFVDSIYVRQPKAWQHPFDDTVSHSYVYRIRIADPDGKVGRAVSSVTATARPPIVDFDSAVWVRVPNGAGSPDYPGSTVAVYRDTLWRYGRDAEGVTHVQTSTDMAQWSPRADAITLPPVFGPTVVFQGKLWMLVARPLDEGETAVNVNTIAAALWNTSDGVHWTEALHKAPFEGRVDCGFTVYQDRIWVLGGQMSWPARFQDIWSTADGLAWVDAKTKANANTYFYENSVAVFGGNLLTVGGGSSMYNDYNKTILASTDGKTWAEHPADAAMLPRMGGTVTEQDGTLWLIGGAVDLLVQDKAKVFNDVWKSEDGFTWSLVNGHAPFQGRWGHKTLSYRGHLYVINGYSLQERLYDDVWMME